MSAWSTLMLSTDAYAPHDILGAIAIAVITETVSITAVSTESHISPMVQPDASTNITVQLTTLTGTTPSVDVACVVEGVSSGT